MSTDRPQNSKHILVTGTSGFIGSHVAAALSSRGYRVTGTYRSNPPRPVPRYDQGFLGEKIPGGSIDHVQADLSDTAVISRLLDGVDGIVHIAGLAGDWGPESAYNKANIEPVHHILELLNQPGRRQIPFIHTSSISVHGFGPHHFSSEEGPYYRLITPYQRSKLRSEELMSENALTGTAIIRPANVYGPYDTTSLYPMLDAIQEGRMGLVNKGRQLTSPIFIDDMVNAYVLLLSVLFERPDRVPPARIYNIASSQEISWEQQVSQMCQAAALPYPRLQSPGWLAMLAARILVLAYGLMRSRTPPDLTPYRIQQVSNDYSFSSARAQSEFGWQAQVLFEDGIRETADTWKNNARPSGDSA